MFYHAVLELIGPNLENDDTVICTASGFPDPTLSGMPSGFITVSNSSNTFEGTIIIKSGFICTSALEVKCSVSTIFSSKTELLTLCEGKCVRFPL